MEMSQKKKVEDGQNKDEDDDLSDDSADEDVPLGELRRRKQRQRQIP